MKNIPGLDGWIIEYFIGFLPLFEEDFLRALEEVKNSRRIPL